MPEKQSKAKDLLDKSGAPQPTILNFPKVMRVSYDKFDQIAGVPEKVRDPAGRLEAELFRK